jgi:hypothetical protein
MSEAPKDDYEALVLALTLALTAHTDQLADNCTVLAEKIANAGGLTDKQIADAQVEAAAAAELWEAQ